MLGDLAWGSKLIQWHSFCRINVRMHSRSLISSEGRVPRSFGIGSLIKLNGGCWSTRIISIFSSTVIEAAHYHLRDATLTLNKFRDLLCLIQHSLIADRGMMPMLVGVCAERLANIQ